MAHSIAFYANKFLFQNSYFRNKNQKRIRILHTERTTWITNLLLAHSLHIFRYSAQTFFSDLSFFPLPC